MTKVEIPFKPIHVTFIHNFHGFVCSKSVYIPVEIMCLFHTCTRRVRLSYFPSDTMTTNTSVHTIGENSGPAPPAKRPRCDEIVTDDDIFEHGRVVLECDVCESYFFSQINLDRHAKNHALQKDFNCRTCGMKYTTKNSLQLHQRSAHTEPRERQPIQRGGGATLPEVPLQVNY